MSCFFYGPKGILKTTLHPYNRMAPAILHALLQVIPATSKIWYNPL
jgi:hypothetical protein